MVQVSRFAHFFFLAQKDGHDEKRVQEREKLKLELEDLLFVGET